MAAKIIFEKVDANYYKAIRDGQQVGSIDRVYYHRGARHPYMLDLNGISMDGYAYTLTAAKSAARSYLKEKAA